ncbi:MAG: protein kinase [Deltaproteobacteria bacterium]|nr:protein kinase [Deltaproteobacteria bacterium]
MTEVYTARLAEEVGPGRLLVIKLLPQTSKDDPDEEIRFLEEARIVLNLTHGNITAAFEFGRAEERPFLVMEYVPGPSLRRLLDSCREQKRLLEIQDSLFIIREVFRALSYAHSFSDHAGKEHGLVHRDISPDNILISTAGQVKLTDFGIAQFVQRGLLAPVWGKAAYIAPEVVAGNPPTPASDMYSLGAVLYECLVGVPPFKGDTDEETLELVRTQIPDAPSTLRDGIPDALDSHVLRLLSKDPEERPSPASEAEVEVGSLLSEAYSSYTEPALAKAVRRYFPTDEFFGDTRGDFIRASLSNDRLAGRTVPLGDENRASPKQEDAPSKTPFVFGVVALVVLVAIVILGIRLWDDKKPPPPAPIATTPTESNETREIPAALVSSDAGTLVPKAIKPVENDALKKGATKKPPRIARSKKVNKSEVIHKGSTGDRHKKPDVAETEWGWLNINSYPWSYVTVDGKKLDGHTPYRRVKLSRGSHTLVFTNPDLGLKATRKVIVKSWEETSIGARLE